MNMRAGVGTEDRGLGTGTPDILWERPWPRWQDGGRASRAKPRRLIVASRSDGIIGVKSMRSRGRGFTLLEVIIAFAVLALALTLLLGTLSGSAREVRASADAGRAAMHAQSLLDQVGVGEALRPGSRDGEFEDGRYRWNLSIERYVDPARRARDTLEPGAPQLMLLALHVEWGEGGPRERLDLQSLRLAQPDAMGAAL